MKKTLMMLAIAACVVQAQAFLSTGMIRIYKGNAGSSLSAYDNETLSGGALPTDGSYIVKKDSIIKSWSGVTVAGETLSEGYKVYMISDATATSAELYSTLVSYLSNASYCGFANKYMESCINDAGKDNNQNQMFYASVKSAETLELNTTIDTATAAKSVAVFTYISADGENAQYNVIAFDSVESPTEGRWYSYFDGTASGSSGDSTGWQSFASVPEPTSGMLMLLGLAGLCLRRKQK